MNPRGRYELSNRRVRRTHPAGSPGEVPKLPLAKISRKDAAEFLRWMNGHVGYRLSDEAIAELSLRWERHCADRKAETES